MNIFLRQIENNFFAYQRVLHVVECMMSYLHLIMAVASSLAIAVLLRIYEHKQINRVVMIAVNYIAAASLAWMLAQNKDVGSGVYVFGSIIGFFFVIAFITFSKAIKLKGIASTVTIGRLSLAVPVLVSILLWGEKPGILDILSLLAIFLIILLWEGKLGRISPILILIFCLFGAIDTSIKYFKMNFSVSDEGFFLVVIFGAAAVWSWLYLLIKRIKIKRQDVVAGIVLGIPNFFSTHFLLLALETIPAYVTFPFVNLGLIISSGLVGHLFFKEHLSLKKASLMLLGMLAVFILTT